MKISTFTLTICLFASVSSVKFFERSNSLKVSTDPVIKEKPVEVIEFEDYGRPEITDFPDSSLILDDIQNGVEDVLMGAPIRQITSENKKVLKAHVQSPKFLNYLLFQAVHNKKLQVQSVPQFNFIMRKLEAKKEALLEERNKLYSNYLRGSKDSVTRNKIEELDKMILKIKVFEEYCSSEKYPCYEVVERFK